jgi:hypothetical protein
VQQLVKLIDSGKRSPISPLVEMRDKPGFLNARELNAPLAALRLTEQIARQRVWAAPTQRRWFNWAKAMPVVPAPPRRLKNAAYGELR